MRNQHLVFFNNGEAMRGAGTFGSASKGASGWMDAPEEIISATKTSYTLKKAPRHLAFYDFNPS
jgi:hypothetical protein